MWVIRKGNTAANENLRDCSQSIIRGCKWHGETCCLVSPGNKKPSCGAQPPYVCVYVCVCSVNRKPPISIRANIYRRVMRLAEIRHAQVRNLRGACKSGLAPVIKPRRHTARPSSFRLLLKRSEIRGPISENYGLTLHARSTRVWIQFIGLRIINERTSICMLFTHDSN